VIHYGAGPNDGVVVVHQGDEEMDNDKEGTTLVQETPERRQGRGGRHHIPCFKCKKKGHYKSECPLYIMEGQVS
jgi:hypothetical protein